MINKAGLGPQEIERGIIVKAAYLILLILVSKAGNKRGERPTAGIPLRSPPTVGVGRCINKNLNLL